MSARAVIACSPHKMVAYKQTVGVGTMGLEPCHVMSAVGTETADAILSALDAAGFKVIHRDDLMKFLKAMEAAKETT